MAVRRLSSRTTDSSAESVLATADGTYIASVIATNTTTVDAVVNIFVRPFNSGTTVAAYSFLAVNLTIGAGQSFETFRFALESGDEVVVQATSGTVNFTATAIYESEGRSNITVSPIEPTFPTVGDIWLNSLTDVFSIWNTSDWATVASAVPVGPIGATGPTGPQGAQGRPSIDFSILGVVATAADLPEFGTLFSLNVVTDEVTYASAYYVADSGDIYAWRESGWVNIGPIVGPTGPQAVNFSLIGEVFSVEELPVTPPTVPEVNGIAKSAAYYVVSSGSVYVWNEIAWVSVGPVVGPTGPTGPAGATGPTGSPAVAITLLGSVLSFAELPETDNSIGDAYYATTFGPETGGDEPQPGLYMWSGSSWDPISYVVGPTGATGPAGLDGDATAYAPTTTADWDEAPTTIADALDELAARLRLLEP